MENVLLIISFLLWWNQQPPDDFNAQLTRFVCNHHQAECGMFENPLDPDNPWEFIECGLCDGQQMCGGDFPESDGTTTFGTEGKCGGGCIETKAFTCEKGVAVVCSRIWDPPRYGCQMVKDNTDKNIVTNKWCC